jgi:hypothetical protein
MLNIFSLIFSQPRLSLGFVFSFLLVHPLDIIPAEYEEKKVINVIYIAAHSGELDLTCAPHPSSSSATAPCILHRLCVCVCVCVWICAHTAAAASTIIITHEYIRNAAQSFRETKRKYLHTTHGREGSETKRRLNWWGPFRPLVSKMANNTFTYS